MRQRGLTLIELMIALALFAVIGVLCWRATVQLVDARDAVSVEVTRWRELDRAFARIEAELANLAPGAAPVLSTAAGASELALTTTGDGGLTTATRFRAAQGRLDWLLADNAEGAGLEVVPLLDSVRRAEWRFLADDRWTAEWPDAEMPAALPDAIALELELDDAGTVSRVFALR